MQEPLIEFKQVSKRFGDKVVLDRADLSVYPGQVTTLIGKSGVGKSVTLKLIIGLLRPDSGQVLYQGQDLGRMPSREKKQLLRGVNYMFQNNALFDSLNVFENIALPLREKYRLGHKEVNSRVKAKMQLLDLGDIGHNFPSQISGGMQKRVAMARALITDPEVVLFDEPTTGLDPLRKNNVLGMITENQKEFGFTSVLVSHDVPDIFYISNRIAVLDEGRVLFQGTAQELEQFENQIIHDFINSSQSLKNHVLGLQTKQELENIYRDKILQGGLEDGFVLLLWDIANLERVEEQVGHFMGQEIVSVLTQAIQKRLRGDQDLLGRYSQDRLVCLVSSADLYSAEQLTRDVMRELQDLTFMHRYSSSPSCVDFSITAAALPGNRQKTLQQLVSEASLHKGECISLVCGQEQ